MIKRCVALLSLVLLSGAMILTFFGASACGQSTNLTGQSLLLWNTYVNNLSRGGSSGPGYYTGSTVPPT